MSENELVGEIHSHLSGGDMSEGISLCFELATDKPNIAANIFTTYRPKIIKALHGWAREVNEHREVFLPHSLFECDAPRAYEEMREFEEKYGGIIDVQAQATPIAREHVDTANSMEAQRQAITQAYDRWHTDGELRKVCATDNPEYLDQDESTAIKIAEDSLKKAYKKEGIKINDVDRDVLRNQAIALVKNNREYLSEAALRRRKLGQLHYDLKKTLRKMSRHSE